MTKLTQRPTDEQPTEAKSLLAQQIIDIFDVLTERTEELPLRDLERLEKELTTALRVNVIHVIAQKQVHFVAEGYALNPLLPANFSNCANDDRPESHRFWWGRPYILTKPLDDKTYFWVECLDGGAWDRPTWWGDADSLDAAVEICRNGPSWTKTK